MNANNPTPEQKLKRALWLAFQASTPLGMGWIHAESAALQTEETLWTQLEGKTDFYQDYCHGRMMKTKFKLDGEKVIVSPEEPRLDYQSWGEKYKSATELLAAVDASF